MINVVSTFSGTGGSSLGYKLAGCKVLASVEFIPMAAECYKLNFPDTPIIQKDIRKITGKEILKLIGLKKGELDILDGSPPCAAFSTSGKREKLWGKVKNYSDTKQRVDDLFDEQIRLISEIRPKAIVIENVKGMTQQPALSLLQNYILKLKNIGYDIKCEVLNSKYFETATSRERVFIMGFRKDLKLTPKLPKPSHKPITFNEATKNIKIPEKEKKRLAAILSKHFSCTKLLPYTRPGEHLGMYHHKGNFFSKKRLHGNKPMRTITTHPYDIFAPSGKRFLTISEIKACSSFPESFKLIGNYNQQFERIGRAVPPNLMKHIALCIKKELTK